MTVADRIRNRRESLGLTQDQLADRMGLRGKSSISKIETSGDKITLKTVEKVAQALNCEPRDIMGWSEADEIPVLKKPESNNEIPRLIKPADSHKEYYFDEETAAAAQELFENKDLRILFDAARDARPEDLKLAADMLRRFKETNPDD